MPTRLEIEEKVKSIICDELGVAPEEISDRTRIAEDLGADSLDMVEMMMRFEEEFNTEIDDATAERLATFQQIVDHIESNEEATI